jgi:hypothetical protein
MQEKRTRWREAISLYICSTAPFRVTSRYSLYMLWYPLRLWCRIHSPKFLMVVGFFSKIYAKQLDNMRRKPTSDNENSLDHSPSALTPHQAPQQRERPAYRLCSHNKCAAFTRIPALPKPSTSKNRQRTRSSPRTQVKTVPMRALDQSFGLHMMSAA